ncbi:M15 family metallopeptidase [Alteromonas gilva]|uniref:D-alanyl-D-alanine dipeptidase n=1 Tax=Alteromonas gilva TaxID=2987522 RepID=A0ABT5KZ95_9ALTE|nr:M15 family metallopeptidase [Alteromonas gilva]MDC8829509.1 M15 family metallopeptidase [Alteromonas gilva]
MTDVFRIAREQRHRQIHEYKAMINKTTTAIGLILLTASELTLASTTPHQFVDVKSVIRDVNTEIRYYSDDNFVGTRIDGYEAAKCLLHRAAANDLKQASEELAGQGYRLKIFDCYRPEQAVAHFMRWAQDISDQSTKSDYYPNIEKADLVPDYIAARSGHSRGYTIDLTLEQVQADGSYKEVDMGSPFDMFDTLSNTDDSRITETQKRHRYQLKSIMHKHHFSAYSMEWWHFTHESDPKTNYWDFPVK